MTAGALLLVLGVLAGILSGPFVFGLLVVDALLNAYVNRSPRCRRARAG